MPGPPRTWGPGSVRWRAPIRVLYCAPVLSTKTRELIRRRLAAEVGRLDRDAGYRVALAYPSPYSVAMSSLGYQQIYRLLQSLPGMACERVFLPDEGASRTSGPLEEPVSYEGRRSLREFPVVALSVAYELELAGVVRLLQAGGIGVFSDQRGPHEPFVLAGGPLTFSNPWPLCPFVDAIVMGEAEDVLPFVMEVLRGTSSKQAALEQLRGCPHLLLPAMVSPEPPRIARCEDGRLPAFGPIVTPHTELADMFLIEAERGCSRGCTYCVMRRSTNGGMRIVPAEGILSTIPREARRVGLVGAAVSDHPEIVAILNALADRGCEVGLSSLRPDKLKDDLVEALARVGYRTLTTALDGASERLREQIDRRGHVAHYVAAAERARRHGMARLKLYLMIGLPGETDEDLDECVDLVASLSRQLPVALAIAPFCAKRNTPLDGQPFAGIRRVEAKLDRLRRGLAGRADVRAISARWAWVEHVLAQGGVAEGRALAGAVLKGGSYAQLQRAFRELGHEPDGTGYERAIMPPLARKHGRRLGVTA